MSLLFVMLLVGLFIGTFGTLIGAGGGFILVPVLLLIYPNKSPESITAISLAVVFFNALSGSLAYHKLKRIDIRSGILFSFAALPGSLLGAWMVRLISRSIFDSIFGLLLIALSLYLILNSGEPTNESEDIPGNYIIRRITDIDSIHYVYGYHPGLGIFLSFIVGFVSSLLGIGGGIIHVPALINLLNFPVHIATATSHFVLSLMAFSGSIVHLFSGDLLPSINLIAPLSLGAISGAQIGARLSTKIQGTYIIKSLAIALGLVGIRILFLAIQN